MPLGLHPNAKAAMLAKLKEGLPHIQVKNGVFIEGFTSFLAAYQADQALPENGKARDQLVEYIDEHPFIDFVTEYLRKDLYDNNEYNGEVERQNIGRIGRYNDTDQLAV